MTRENPFTWTNCQLCGLFRECDDVIPPTITWSKLEGERLLTERRYVCFECKKREGKRLGYYEFIDLVFEGFNP